MKYYLVSLSSFNILEKEVIKETPHSVFVKDTVGREVKRAKVSNYEEWYSSKVDARNRLNEYIDSKISHAEKSIRRYQVIKKHLNLD